MLEIVRAGGLGGGGFNFDAKVRRQSIEPEDLLRAHVGGLDAMAKALLAAERIIADGTIDRERERRYAGWPERDAVQLLQGNTTLVQIADEAASGKLKSNPRSGRQEYLEQVISWHQ